MTTSPATIPLLLDKQDGESVPKPEVNGGEVCCGNEEGVDDKAKPLGSMPNTAPSDADVPLGHSIELPVELWEKVIDVLADEWVGILWHREAYEARLRVLGRVCRGWHARCRFRGLERLDMMRMDKMEVYSLINTLRQDPERCNAMKTVSFQFEEKSVGLFGTFAVCMAQKLPRVERLVLWPCKWEPRQLHAQVFVHITLAFESVTVLALDYVRFPSAVVFGRLLRALPRLSSLACLGVSFDKHGYVAGQIWKLHPLRLDHADVQDSNDVVDFLVSIDAQLRHFVWRHQSFERCHELLSVTAESLSSMRTDLTYYTTSVEQYPNDLTPAINLRVLSISAHLEDLNRAAMILSRASLPKLIEVTITVSTFVYGGTLPSSSIKNTLDEVDKDSYALLDQAFSSRQYPALNKVTFNLHCDTWRSDVMKVISEVSWRSHVASNLPTLHTSGRLVCSVSILVDNEWK